MLKKVLARIRRKNKIKAKITGTLVRPRLSIFRSNRHIFAQAIDDVSKKTIASISSNNIKDYKNKSDAAKKTGQVLAEKILAKKIKSIVFDRNGYKFHGRVKTFAEGMREKGIKF